MTDVLLEAPTASPTLIYAPSRRVYQIVLAHLREITDRERLATDRYAARRARLTSVLAALDELLIETLGGGRA